MCHLENNLLPVQSVIRTFLAKKLWRLVKPYPKSYMVKMQTKMHTNGELFSQTLAITGFGWWRWRQPLLLILLNKIHRKVKYQQMIVFQRLILYFFPHQKKRSLGIPFFASSFLSLWGCSSTGSSASVKVPLWMAT